MQHRIGGFPESVAFHRSRGLLASWMNHWETFNSESSDRPRESGVVYKGIREKVEGQ